MAIMGNRHVCTPAYERMKYLHALGYSVAEIHEILGHEFKDIDINPLSFQGLAKFIVDHKDEFEGARLEIAKLCKEQLHRNMQILFGRAHEVESRMVDIYMKKANKVLDQMSDLDLEERDDLGNFINTSRFFILIEMMDKLQSKVSKIVGTDSMRDIEVYRQKMELKQRADENLLIPGYGKPAVGREVSSGPTSFIS